MSSDDESNHGHRHDDHHKHDDHQDHHKHHGHDHHKHHGHVHHKHHGHDHHKHHDHDHHHKHHGHHRHHSDRDHHRQRYSSTSSLDSDRDHHRQRCSSSSSSDSDHDPTTHEWKKDFSYLMQSKKGRKEFYKYLKKEEKMHAIAQFKFMKACKDYRKEKDEDDRKKEAKKIYKKYIGSRSDEDRIPGMEGERLERIRDNLGDPDVFREAEEYTMKYLKDEYYEHFIESGHYNSILHSFFVYNTAKNG